MLLDFQKAQLKMSFEGQLLCLRDVSDFPLLLRIRLDREPKERMSRNLGPNFLAMPCGPTLCGSSDCLNGRRLSVRNV